MRLKSAALGAGDGLVVINAEGLDGDFRHDLIFARSVGPIARGGNDGLCDIDALGDLAECGILAVEMGGVIDHDEELAACAVRALASCHGENAGGVLQIVLEAVHSELTLDAVAGAAHAGAFRVAALDHEARDDAVEDGAVIKALLNEGNKVVDRVRRNLGVKLRLDGAAGGLESNNRILHTE